MKQYLLFFSLFLLLFSSCIKDEDDNHSSYLPSAMEIPIGWGCYETTLDDPYYLALDNSENVWYANGTALEKRVGNTVTAFASAIVPVLGSRSTISSLTFDSSNNLWIGTRHSSPDPGMGGLIKFNGSTAISYNLSNQGCTMILLFL